MSTDWNVYCRTCNAEHRFDDANHMYREMHYLIKHAAGIAALAPLVLECDRVELRLGEHYGQIDPEWFATHLGHDLVPIDEYGRFSDQCPEDAECSCCGARRHCALPITHTGPHEHVARNVQGTKT